MRTMEMRSPTASAEVPGARLLRGWPVLSALVIAFNDFWLKPTHPGVVSGKLSDIGLCFFFPVFLATVLEWTTWAHDALRHRAWQGAGRRSHALACALAAAYFAMIKISPAGAELHVQALSALLPSRRFRAVADPTDLLCLPLVLVAYSYLARARRRA
jgi:hypothetical protein